MSALPAAWIVRHGETEWSRAGRHTGRTDLPLTDRGEEDARRLAPRLRERCYARVLTSPSIRARRTAELAGFADALVDPELAEWDYGEDEGLTSLEIRARRPGWDLFRDGCPGGESVEEVRARADRVIERLRAIEGDVLVFSSGHFLRVLASRWMGFPAAAGGNLFLETATLGALGYEHDRSRPVLLRWNAPPGDERC